MGQVASAFPTAGGLYHWASILGGRGWGWATAWFNLAGLVTVLAAINVGAYRFVVGRSAGRSARPGRKLGFAKGRSVQIAVVAAHHRLAGAVQPPRHPRHHAADRFQRLLDPAGRGRASPSACCWHSPRPRLQPPGDASPTTAACRAGEKTVWPRTDSLVLAVPARLPPAGLHDDRLRRLGPHRGRDGRRRRQCAARHRPLGAGLGRLSAGSCSPQSCWPSPNMRRRGAAGRGASSVWIIDGVLPGLAALALFVGIGVAQYLCGLATVTSASRMAYRLRPRRRPARLRAGCAGSARRTARRRSPSGPSRPPAGRCSPSTRRSMRPSPPSARSSSTSPTCCRRRWGCWRYGRTWTPMGPWHLGRWYRPLAVVSVLGCGVLIVIGVQPPNDKAAWSPCWACSPTGVVVRLGTAAFPGTAGAAGDPRGDKVIIVSRAVVWQQVRERPDK